MIRVEANELREGIKKVYMNKNSPIEISFVDSGAIRLRTTDLPDVAATVQIETTVEADIEEAFKPFTIPSVMYQLIDKDDIIHINPHEGTVNLLYGSGKYNFINKELILIKFEEILKDNERQEEAENGRFYIEKPAQEKLVKLSNYVARDGYAYGVNSSLYCYKIEKIEGNKNIIAVATDGSMMAIVKIAEYEDESSKFGVKISSDISKYLKRLDADRAEVLFNRTYVKFVGDNIKITTRQLDGGFPDYKSLVKSLKFDKEMVVEKDSITQALSRIKPVEGDIPKVEFKLSKNNLKLTTKTTEDEAETDVACQYENGDGTIEFAFNPNVITRALSGIDSEKLKIKFHDEQMPFRIYEEATNNVFLMMPLRSEN